MDATRDRRTEPQPYTRPQVETLEVSALLEAVGPAQALSSGADAAAALTTKATLRPSGSRPDRGSR